MGDHIALLNIYNEWSDNGNSLQWTYENFVQIKALKRARDIRDQLAKLCERVEIQITSNSDPTAIRKSIVEGFFMNTAKLQKSGNYKY